MTDWFWDRFDRIDIDNSRRNPFNKFYSDVAHGDTHHELSKWRGSPKYGTSYRDVDLVALTREVLRFTDRRELETWLNVVAPTKYDDRMSITVNKIWFDEGIASGVPVGGVSQEVVSRQSSTTQSFRRYGKALSIWDNMLNSPIGLFYLDMKTIQVGEEVFMAFFKATINAMLGSRNYFVDWTLKNNYYSKSNVKDYYQREITRWNIVPTMDNGLNTLLTEIDDEQALYFAGSDTVIIPLKMQSYLRNVKKDQRQYNLIGNRTSGFQNKYDSKQPIGMVQENQVFRLRPFVGTSGKPRNYLARTREIGEYHPVYDINYPHNPELYSTKDITPMIYDQANDSICKISPANMIKNLPIWTSDGYVCHADVTYSNNKNVGTGFNKEDKLHDILSTDEGDPITLIGQMKHYNTKHAVYTSRAIKNIVSKHYRGMNEVSDIWKKGMNAMKTLQNIGFTKSEIDAFKDKHGTLGNVMRGQNAGSIFKTGNSVPQLIQHDQIASYEPVLKDGYLQSIPAGYGSEWGMEMIGKQTSKDSYIQDIINDCKNYTKLQDRLQIELERIIPETDYHDTRYNPFALQRKKAKYGRIVNTLNNTTSFQWINVAKGANDKLIKLFSIESGVNASSSDVTDGLKTLKTNESFKNMVNKLRRYNYNKDNVEKVNEQIKNDISLFGDIKVVDENIEGVFDEPVEDETKTSEDVVMVEDEDEDESKSAQQDEDILSQFGQSGNLNVDTRISQFTIKGKKKKSDVPLISMMADLKLEMIAVELDQSIPLNTKKQIINNLIGRYNGFVSKIKSKKIDLFEFLNIQGPSRLFPDTTQEYGSFENLVNVIATSNSDYFRKNKQKLKEFLAAFGLKSDNRVLTHVKSEYKDEVNHKMYNNKEKNDIILSLSNAPFTYLKPSIRVQFDGSEPQAHAVSPRYQMAFINMILRVLSKPRKNDGFELFDQLLKVLVFPYVRKEQPKFNIRTLIKWLQGNMTNMPDPLTIYGYESNESLIEDFKDVFVSFDKDKKLINQKIKKSQQIDLISKKIKQQLLKVGSGKTKAKWVQTTRVFSPKYLVSLSEYYQNRGISNEEDAIILPANPDDEHRVGTLNDLHRMAAKIENAGKNSYEYPPEVRNINQTSGNDVYDFHYLQYLKKNGQLNITSSDRHQKISDDFMFGGAMSDIFDLRGDKDVTFGLNRHLRKDISHENMSSKTNIGIKTVHERVRPLFKTLQRDANDSMETSIARSVLMSTFSLKNLLSMQDKNVPIPFEMTLYKLNMRYTTYSIIKIQSGGVAMKIIKGNPVFTMQNDATEQRHYAQFTMTGGPFFEDRKFLYVQHDVMVQSAIGGASTEFYDVEKQRKLREKYYNPYTLTYGQNNESLMVGILPIGSSELLPLDVHFSGHNWDLRRLGYLRKADIEQPYVNGFDGLRRMKWWGLSSGNNGTTQSRIASNVNGYHPNLMTHKAPTWYYNRYQGKWNILKAGRCHWGIDASKPGALSFRGGQPTVLKTIDTNLI